MGDARSKQGHFGLQGAHERARDAGGCIRLSSAAGAGTTLTLTIPGRIAYRRDDFPSARIIALTTYCGDILSQRALRAGAQAYLLKSKAGEDLLDTIRVVHAGHRRVDPDVAAFLGHHLPDDALTAREVAVLERIVGGQPRQRIARDLAITESTVGSHLKNIVSKLDAGDATHAAMVGLERGIIGFWSRTGATVTARARNRPEPSTEVR